MNKIQNKILYINIMMFIMLIAGIAFGIMGLIEPNKDMHYTIIIESIAAPLVVGSISMLGIELKHYLNIRCVQEKQKIKEEKK